MNSPHVTGRPACLVLLFLSLLATPAAFGQALSGPGLAFGNQAVTETSTGRSISFRNTLAVPVTLLTVTASGGQSADFASTPGCVLPALVAPGKSCAVSVRFTPGALGLRTSSLVFAHNQAGSPLTATLSGTGVPPVSLAPTILSFGNVMLGAVSATRTATLTNAQNAQLSIASITPTPPFSRQGGTCPIGTGVLAGRASCTVVMTFSPIVAGAANGSLTVMHGANNSPLSVALSGTGVAPLAPSPSSVSFPSRAVGTTSPPVNIGLVNKSGALLALGAIAASGDFAVSSTTCGASLAAGAKCVIGVTFTPAGGGARAGILSIVHGAFGSPLQIPLSGTGIGAGPVSIAVTPANPALGLGVTQQLVATATYGDGTTSDITSTAQWEIGDPLRGRVTSGGQYTALASGDNTVTARVGVVQGDTTVTGARPVYFHRRSSATTLLDGRVLIAGGLDPNGATAHAELFDPASGTFTVTGSMTATRYGHSATRLPDGRVLVAGGMFGASATSSAEIFDPVTGTWTATGTLRTARAYHEAVLVDSKVLLSGGNLSGLSGGNPIASAELFDPVTGTFALTGSLATARWLHTATLLADGRVLVVGGAVNFTTHYWPHGTAEIYQTATGTWTPAGSLVTPRFSHSATLLENGKVLVAGGAEGVGLTSAQLYDPVAGTWALTGSLPTWMFDHVAARLPGGDVLLAGGGPDWRLTTIYDPASGTFAPAPPLAYGRDWPAGAPLDDGSVLLVGGYDLAFPGTAAANSAELRTGAMVLTGLTVTPSSTTVTHPSTVTFSAIGTFSDGSTGDVTGLATWTATPGSVATVTSPGKVNTVGPGTATITATFGAFSFAATLTVN